MLLDRYSEGIGVLPKDVQMELVPALEAYVSDGTLPAGLSDVAMGIFLILRADIDAGEKRRAHGRDCAKYGRLGGRPRKKPASAIPNMPAPSPVRYILTCEQEVAIMGNDATWVATVVKRYGLTERELSLRLEDFLADCNCSGKRHKGVRDAKRHFCLWLRRQRCSDNTGDYSYNGGFGGQD